MPTTLQFRRGNNAQNNSFTGAAGEITFDTTNKTLRIHDASTAGGTRLATHAEVSAISASSSLDSARVKLFTLDSAETIQLIDSDYIQARVTPGTDSAATITLINTRITATLIDEDNMSSNSATRLPSQQSVKAYVDSIPWLDQSTKEDGSVIYWKNSSSKYFADNAQNIKTLEGGNF